MSSSVSATPSPEGTRRCRAKRLGGSREVVIAIFALALVALAGRAYHIGSESLWLDETASVAVASQPLMRVRAGEVTNPPLYYILLHFWIRAFGSEEAAIRWPSLCAGVAAVLLTYCLARRLYDHRIAIVSAVFMAITPYQIHYSQEARAFALLLFLCLAATLFLHVALTRPSGSHALTPWLLYGVTTIAALHTHFHAVFVVAAHNIFFVLYWRKHQPLLRRWILLQATILVAFSAWLFTMLQAAGTAGGQVRRYLPLKLPEAVVSFLVGDTLVPFDEAAIQHIRETLLSHSHYIVAFVVGFGIYLASALVVFQRRRYASTFVLVMFLVPLLVPFIVSFGLNIFDRRYVIAASPFLYMVLGAGVVHLHDAAALRRPAAMIAHVLAASLVVSLLGVSLYNYYLNPRFGKEQWREVVALVEAAYLPGDLVLFDPDYLRVSYGYYSRRPVSQLPLLPHVRDEHGPAWQAALAAVATHKRVWLIRSHLFTGPVLPRLRRTLPATWHAHFPKAKGIDVYLLQREAGR